MGILSHPLGLPLLLHTIDSHCRNRKRVIQLGYMVINANVKHLASSLQACSEEFRSTFPKEVFNPSNYKSKVSNELIFKTLFDKTDIIDNYIAKNSRGAATIKHDMNLPILNKYHNKFDLAVDAGTLEHIFNYPQALINISEMLNIGGLAYHFLPACGWLEHGFTQFSAEALMSWYKINGFDIISAFYSMQNKNIDYYSNESFDEKNFKIVDILSNKNNDLMAELKQRNDISVVDMIVISKKKTEVGRFDYPQQGFWAEHWKKTS